MCHAVDPFELQGAELVKVAKVLAKKSVADANYTSRPNRQQRCLQPSLQFFECPKFWFLLSFC